MQPKISVITINLNNAEGLKRTMDTVYCQSFRDFEYIIVDGGSLDGSTEVIKEFQELIKVTSIRFQSMSEPDRGIYNAMNKGIYLASGEYCFFLNSGDYFASSEVLQNVMKVHPEEDILYGNMLVCLNGKVIEKSFGKPQLTFMDLYLSGIKHQASFIKRSLFYEFGFYDESNKIVSDWEFFLKTIGLKNATYRFINEDITFFDNGGVSNNAHEIRIAERNRILETNIPPLILADYRYFGEYEFLRPALKNKFFFLAIRFLAKCAKTLYRSKIKR